MASIYKEARLAASVDKVWAAISDLGGVNRLISFLGEVKVEGEHRNCSLGDLGKVDELIVTVDEANKRLVYSARRSPFNFTHHNSSMQVLPDGEGTRFLWTTDSKPDGAAPQFEEALEAALDSIKQALG